MRRTLVILLAVAAVLSLPSSAFAASVFVLGPHGHVHERNDPYLGSTAITPAPATGPMANSSGGGGGGLGTGTGTSAPPQPKPKPKPKPTPKPGKKHKKRPAITFRSTIAGLLHAGTITASQAHGALGAFNGAITAEKHLSGVRKSELTDVTETIHRIAADHELTASRVPAVVATLNANRQWWTTGSLLASGARVEFTGSELEWEYYPGQGIQLQVLGSFGKANGLYAAGPAHYAEMKQLLAEIIPLASQRAGGLAWEYWFDFDGGSPPWTSAMSQATGLEALSRAYLATKDPYYLKIAGEAMPLFTAPPPEGVQVRTPRGVRFLQYTFAPSLSIINAFLQTLIGLHDYAQVSHNQTAATLFAEGNREAQWELPSFNTGAWSLYQPGDEDDLSYHELVTGFLGTLCQQLDTPVYCTTYQDFSTDLKTPPTLADLTPHVKAKHDFAFRFRLSKISRVGLTIANGSGATVFASSAEFVHGVGSFAVGKLKPGTYTVTIAATDLAGNFARLPGTLLVNR